MNLRQLTPTTTDPALKTLVFLLCAPLQRGVQDGDYLITALTYQNTELQRMGAGTYYPAISPVRGRHFSL